MGDAAVLILPSHCAESFGRVVIEAFAKGTPVICANQGGQAELVHPGIGATFRSGDPDDLARVVDALIAGPCSFNRETNAWHYDLLQAMRLRARLEYVKHYTEAINHAQLQQIYAAAITRRWPQRSSSPLRNSNDHNTHCDHELGRRTPTGL